MKYYENNFEEYIQTNKNNDLHPKLDKKKRNLPKNIHDLKNIIFYGPDGVGKYTQMLKFIKDYSPSYLRYNKKISVIYNKQSYYLKISDIHYELDMGLLGCNSKLLWHEIYQQIIDIISAKIDKVGIIVCKNFQEIHNELLDNFYSYMQLNGYGLFNHIDIKFILITNNISFINDNILNCCEIISIARPSKNQYNKCLKIKIPNQIKLENINNIKNLYSLNTTKEYNVENIMQNHKLICNKIIYFIINSQQNEPVQFDKLRDLLYDILIYNVDVSECIWYILNNLLENKKMSSKSISSLMSHIYKFFQYYNNNYRPIYHLENLIFYFIQELHIDYKNIKINI